MRDAIRQMQQREIEQFERLFGKYPGAPQGEPTPEDDEAIKSAILLDACMIRFANRIYEPKRTTGQALQRNAARGTAAKGAISLTYVQSQNHYKELHGTPAKPSS